MTQEPDTQAFTPEQLEEIRDIANEIAQSKMPRYFRKERVIDEPPSAGQDPCLDEKRGKWVPSTSTGLASHTDAHYLTNLYNPTPTTWPVGCPPPGGVTGWAVGFRTGRGGRAGEPRSRIGVNVGDVVIEDGDILGDGVNIAARLEGVAEPGGVAISGAVREYIVGRIDGAFRDGGRRELKNIGRPIAIWHWSPEGARSAPAAPPLALPDKPSIAVLPFDNMSSDPDQ